MGSDVIIHTPGGIKKPNSSTIKPRKWKGLGMRHLIALLGFWGFAMCYATRFNISLAIVVMAQPRDISTHPTVAHQSDNVEVQVEQSKPESGTPESSDDCIGEGSNSSRRTEPGEFDWDEQDQGLILSSFFFGYICTQLPGGMASTKFGAKWVIGIGLFMNALMALVTPIAARANVFMLVYVRFVQGLAQGVIHPAAHSLLAYWSPVEERSLLTSIVYSGSAFGAASTMVCSGYILETCGWPLVFYMSGAVSMIHVVCWLMLVSSKPSDSCITSQVEKDFIVESIGPQNKTYISPPWRKILTSGPVWVISIAMFGHSWGLFTLLNGLPSYLKSVLKFNMEQNSLLNASPYLLQWGFANIISSIVDKINLRGWSWMSKTRTRKICHGIAQIGPAILMIGAILVDCDRAAIVCLIIIAAGLSGGVCGSQFPNQVEIAPNYSGIVMGISNTIGNIPGIGTALAIGALTKNAPTKTNWTYVFVISIVTYFVTSTVYFLFATTDEQPWNKPPEKESKELVQSSPAETTDEKKDDKNSNETKRPKTIEEAISEASILL